MLTACPRRAPRRPRRRTPLATGQAGFTLIELLVTIAASIVVLFALTTILIVTLHQTQRTFTRVDATRQGRTALATIENELHSACVGGAAPVQAGSDADSLWFLSFTGTSAAPTPVWHQLTFDPSGHTLVDARYGVTGAGSSWGRGALTTQTTLLTDVSRQASATPVFQYFAYEQAYVDSEQNAYWAIPDGINRAPQTGTLLAAAPLADSSGLSSAAAGQTVEVLINLLVGASTADPSNAAAASVDDPVTDAISMRLTTPPVEVPAGQTAEGYGPCQ